MTDFTKDLDLRIKTFKNKISQKNEIIVFEPNKLDLYLDNIFNILGRKYKENVDSVILRSLINKSYLFFKNASNYIFNSIKKISSSLNLIIKKFDLLEKKIEVQENLIKQSVKLSKELSEKLEIFNIKLNQISENKLLYSESNKTLFDNNDKENIKINILQEENLRVSSELIENRKKIEIMKSELEKFNIQRSQLINKINSVNEIISDFNIVTTVFDNNLENRIIKIRDPEQPIKKITDLDIKVKEIFKKN